MEKIKAGKRRRDRKIFLDSGHRLIEVVLTPSKCFLTQSLHRTVERAANKYRSPFIPFSIPVSFREADRKEKRKATPGKSHDFGHRKTE